MGAKDFHDVRAYKPDPDPKYQENGHNYEEYYFIGCDLLHGQALYL